MSDDDGPADWRDIAARQAGVISRAQALAAGLTDSGLRAKISSERWQRPFHGVYFTSAAQPVLVQRAWAALVATGEDAVLSHSTAAALNGMLPDRGGLITVSVPISRRPRRATNGLDIYRRRTTPVATGNPRRTPPVDTLLDLVSSARDPLDVIGLITQCASHDAITSQAMHAAVEARPVMPHRGLLLEVIDATTDGVRSALEYRYRRDVEHAHGLPTPTRQRRRRANGRVILRDLEYEEFALVIELDGRLNHERTPLVFRDLARDNASAVAGDASLRYGWLDVAGTPCLTAAQVVVVLKARGWTGQPRRCGPHCHLSRDAQGGECGH